MKNIAAVAVLGLFLFSQPLFPAAIETVEEVPKEELPFKVLNIKTNALYSLNKNWNATLDIAVDPQWTVGISYLHELASSRSSIQLGSQVVADDSQSLSMDRVGFVVNGYFSGSRQTDAFFISSTVSMSLNSLQRNELTSEWKGQNTGYYLAITANKQFMWANGLNLQLGLGLSKSGPDQMAVTNVADSSQTKTVTAPGSFLAGFMPVLAVNAGMAL